MSWTRWKSVYKIIKNHGGGRQKNRPPEKEKNVLTFPRADAIIIKRLKNARVVELVDSLASGASAHSGRAGSTPASRTSKKPVLFGRVFCWRKGSHSRRALPPRAPPFRICNHCNRVLTDCRSKNTRLSGGYFCWRKGSNFYCKFVAKIKMSAGRKMPL